MCQAGGGPPEEPCPLRYTERLRSRIATALAAALGQVLDDPRSIHDAADAVVDELARRPKTVNDRTLILRMCGYAPVCWICGFSIDLGEPNDAPACFSLDHVIPRSAGGGRLGISNLKPAHRLCNIMRSQTRPGRRTRAAYERMMQSLVEKSRVSRRE